MSSIPSARHSLVLAGLAFLAVLIVEYSADLFLARHPGWMLLDDIVLATAASAMVFLYERERSRFLSEKLRVIRDMNSFVRNELQILYASLEHSETSRVPVIEGSVERIDWALRELLPGGQALRTGPVEEIGARVKKRTERSA